jgi:tRNA-dihydrouridine synthase
LKAPDLAVRIVSRVRGAVSIPLSVKFRTGWKDDPGAAQELAGRFEDAGADTLIFHPRVAPDRRSRPPKWAYIGMVKQAVSIPVFGNGDVFDANDCRRMIQQTGCDGVALGRMAIARPWIFAELTDNMPIKPQLFAEAAFQMVTLLGRHYDPVAAVKRLKRFTFYFAANFRFGHTLYSGILKARDMQEAEAVFNRFFDKPPDVGSRPNLNFFK